MTKEEFAQKYATFTTYGDGPSYEEIIEACGVTIVVEASDRDYQGTTYNLVQRNSDGALGLLSYEWGSCSGCDALQGCDNFRDLENLRAGFEGDIAWGLTREEMMKRAEEWSRDSWGEGGREFFGKLGDYFKAQQATGGTP